MIRNAVIATLACLPTFAAAAPVPTDAPPAAPAQPELARRFGIGARAVSMSIGKGDAQTDFGGGGIVASYRLNRRWELALSLDALDSEQGPDLHSTMLSARFHLWPLRRWDVYLVAGLGGLHEMPTEGSDQPEATRGQLHAGAGIGYRWRWIGVSAELHAVGVGPAKVDGGDTAAMRTTGTAMTTDDGTSAGEFALGATVFF